MRFQLLFSLPLMLILLSCNVFAQKQEKKEDKIYLQKQSARFVGQYISHIPFHTNSWQKIVIAYEENDQFVPIITLHENEYVNIPTKKLLAKKDAKLFMIIYEKTGIYTYRIYIAQTMRDTVDGFFPHTKI